MSLVVMPILARAKRQIAAAGIESSALHADARQTDFCTYLSAILLGGFCLNALFGSGGPIQWLPSAWCQSSGARVLRRSRVAKLAAVNIDVSN